MRLPKHALLEVILTINANRISGRTTLQPVWGNINLSEPKDLNDMGGDEKVTTIGRIVGHRALSCWPQEIILAADEESQDVYNGFDWLINKSGFSEDEVDSALFRGALFLDSVTIEPMYRGLSIALPAVSAYIDAINPEFVFCFPKSTGWSKPPNWVEDENSCEEVDPSIKKRRGEAKTDNLLRRYWAKLGLKNYDEKHNILWTEDWACPKWIAAQLND